ncbi:MAG: T9SS type A sorting domain-containing protein [Bacteroidetes bacterium]|nr:T9SS type A sorting domain-containing protein [Bacteroidota bacterium]
MNLDLNNPSDVELKYINMSGQVVKTSRHKNISKQTIQENISTISAGSYIIRVSSMEGIKTAKVIVIK